MQNLAGHPESTTLCAAELAAAGIPLEYLEDPYGEPKSRVGGSLKGFTFRRAWYYWIVKGRMPLAQARALYADKEGATSVRVAGHCGCPPPDEWAEWFGPGGTELYIDPDGSEQEQARKLGLKVSARFVRSLDEVPGARGYVTSYHVDTAEGLKLLADTILALPE